MKKILLMTLPKILKFQKSKYPISLGWKSERLVNIENPVYEFVMES